MILSERERTVLAALVDLFVREAGPVSSGHIQQEIGLGVSSATIRNVLHRLEEKGLLHQPHTSAGRVPTRFGYQLYVTSFSQPARLPSRWLQRIQQELALDRHSEDVQELLTRVSKLLAGLSSNVGLGVAVEEHTDARIERIEIVQLEQGRLLVVVTLDDGLVRTSVVPLERHYRAQALEQAQSMLNEIVVDCTLAAARRRLDVALVYRLGEASELARSVALEKGRIFEERNTPTVHVEGATEIMGEPEFQDPETLRHLVKILDHPENLEAAMRDSVDHRSARITVGMTSTDGELPFSLVSAWCSITGYEGRVGVLGPMRMRYSLVSALVSRVAAAISSLEDARMQEE
jgi:heat-inducible transcriptional repressor